MKILIKHYTELSTSELYEILALRIAVFVVEQNCPYHETDFKDQAAYHLMIHDNDILVGVSRILPPGLVYNEAAIGRVASLKKMRGKGIGHEIMKASIKFINEKWIQSNIRISAQTYLVKFYEDHGFNLTGKSYLEDDIPHEEMLLVTQNQINK